MRNGIGQGRVVLDDAIGARRVFVDDETATDRVEGRLAHNSNAVAVEQATKVMPLE